MNQEWWGNWVLEVPGGWASNNTVNPAPPIIKDTSSIEGQRAWSPTEEDWYTSSRKLISGPALVHHNPNNEPPLSLHPGLRDVFTRPKLDGTLKESLIWWFCWILLRGGKPPSVCHQQLAAIQCLTRCPISPTTQTRTPTKSAPWISLIQLWLVSASSLYNN